MSNRSQQANEEWWNARLGTEQQQQSHSLGQSLSSHLLAQPDATLLLPASESNVPHSQHQQQRFQASSQQLLLFSNSQLPSDVNFPAPNEGSGPLNIYVASYNPYPHAQQLPDQPPQQQHATVGMRAGVMHTSAEPPFFQFQSLFSTADDNTTSAGTSPEPDFSAPETLAKSLDQRIFDLHASQQMHQKNTSLTIPAQQEQQEETLQDCQAVTTSHFPNLPQSWTSASDADQQLLTEEQQLQNVLRRRRQLENILKLQEQNLVQLMRQSQQLVPADAAFAASNLTRFDGLPSNEDSQSSVPAVASISVAVLPRRETSLSDSDCRNPAPLKRRGLWKDADRPKRPLTAYNFFFQHERAIMLGEPVEYSLLSLATGYSGISLSSDSAMALSMVNADSLDASQNNSKMKGDTQTPSSEQQSNENSSKPRSSLESNQQVEDLKQTGKWGKNEPSARVLAISPRRSVKKRGQPHGKWSFQDMARTISKKWSETSPEMREKFQALAVRDKERYLQEKAAYLQRKKERKKSQQDK